MQKLEFLREYGKRLDIKFIIIPNFFERFLQRKLQRIIGPAFLLELRPCCIGKCVFLKPDSTLRAVIHEATHALRIKKYPGKIANWYAQYFVDDTFRALEETSAIMAEHEFLKNGVPMDLKTRLAPYCCGEAAVRLAVEDYKHVQSQHLNFNRSVSVALHVLKTGGERWDLF